MRPTTSVRKSPRKNLPPRNTPDSFCRLLRPTKSIAMLHGRYFSFMVTCRGEAPPSCLCKTVRLLKSPTGTFIAPLRFANANPHLENFMNRLNMIPTFRQRRCTNRDRNFVRSKRRLTYMSSTPSTYFYALTIRKQLCGNNSERSGRGQEPSRGHKFSILENLVRHRDFTSAMHLHFRSDLVGESLVGARPLHLLRKPRCH